MYVGWCFGCRQSLSAVESLETGSIPLSKNLMTSCLFLPSNIAPKKREKNHILLVVAPHPIHGSSINCAHSIANRIVSFLKSH
jgi:hypothetical protein